MMLRVNVLKAAGFGSRIAEDEVDELHSYFVETEQWRKLLAGDVDIVFGAKGSGKSAMYSLLVAQKEKLRLGRRTLFLAAENPRGTPAFSSLDPSAALSEEEFKALWKLYLLTIAASYLRHHCEVTRSNLGRADYVIKILADNNLLAPNVTLLTRLKSVLGYLRRHAPTFEGTVVEPHSGIKLTGKITFSEPTSEQRQQGYFSLDDLLLALDEGFKEQSITAWLVLDRLDVAFSDSEELERNALRSLFRTYLDTLQLSNIRIKIFIRDDIWKKITDGGFREASHVTRALTLSWDHASLLNLLVRRLASNPLICDVYGLHQEDVIASVALQRAFFYKVFPPQIDVGQSKPETLEWMMSRTADGTKRTAPRELIHLLLATRDEQLKMYELGHTDPEREQLFDRSAIRAALPAVSKARYEQTLCAEYPTLKNYLDKLEREKSQQTPKTLAQLWGLTEEKSSEIAEKIAESGFFERRGTKDSPSYWVPFIYREALSLVQGSA